MSYNGTVRCSYCYQTGHNRRTCPELSEAVRAPWRASKSNYERAVKEGNTTMADTYLSRMKNYAERYTKRTGKDVATGERYCHDQRAKKAAKAKRLKNIRCSYCGNTGHTRRTCSGSEG